jgi:hypothetical protein
MIVSIWCASMRAALVNMNDCPISSKFVLQLLPDNASAYKGGLYVLYRVTDEQAKIMHRWAVQQRPAVPMEVEGLR